MPQVLIVLAMFSPQGYPNGKVVYDFSLSLLEHEYSSLQDLEPWRQTFCVRIGDSVLCCSNNYRFLH